jgi:sulfide:quinone oxidoreductase
MLLDRFAADMEVEVVRDQLAAVDAGEHTLTTGSGAKRAFDLLLVAIGARPVPSIPGAVHFHGAVDAPAVRRILDDAAARRCRTIVFAVGPGTSWPLPLYELALLAAGDLRARGVKADVRLVTPEAIPLELFGAQASELIARMLDEGGIEVVCGVETLEAEPGHLHLVDGRRLTADRVVTLPRAAGRFVEGLPHDPAGFIPVDAHGRVNGAPGVYAAGDITTFPFKQGGLATQQADAAAEAMLAELGLPIAPRPFSPVLQGVVYGGGEPAYLRTPIGEGRPAPSAPRAYSLWWPPSKIAGRHLSAYLALRAGAPRAPEVRPSSDVVPVHVELADAVPGLADHADAAGS